MIMPIRRDGYQSKLAVLGGDVPLIFDQNLPEGASHDYLVRRSSMQPLVVIAAHEAEQRMQQASSNYTNIHPMIQADWKHTEQPASLTTLA